MCRSYLHAEVESLQAVETMQWENILIVGSSSNISPVASASSGAEGPIPPKTAKQKLARKNELKAKNNSSSTNETVNTAHSVSATSSKNLASTASYADDVMFSFFSNQSTALQLDNKDLEQIDADDLEEMDLKWQVTMLTMRVKRFIKKTGRKLDLNDKETIGFDRTKVECYNCHRRDHFSRKYRAPRNQGNRNRDAPRRNAPVDTSTTNALVV
ncbi:ribonuclease H-like domain-containing protein [Tanacetum coccineum]